MRDEKPIRVIHLFQPLRDALLDLLRSLDGNEWDRPTVCAGWSVKDVALHLLGGDVGIVSRKRDRFQIPLPQAESFGASINRHNDIWIDASRRLSPELLIDLLDHVGRQAIATFEAVDLDATGDPVSWAGPDPAPVWLDVAREYTERWHHQQHIRDAVDRPGLMDRELAGPVFEAFIHALPWSFRDVDADAGSMLEIVVTGDAGGRWRLVRRPARWELDEPESESPETVVEIPAEVAWKMFTNGLSPEECEAAATITGDRTLARAVFTTRSIIV